MEIAINVCEMKKAQALASLLSKKHNFGPKLEVAVNIFADNRLILPDLRPANTQEALKLMDAALVGNKFYSGITYDTKKNRGIVEFNPLIIQYFTDDISDGFGNTNLAASIAFKQLFAPEKWLKDRIFVVTASAKIPK